VSLNSLSASKSPLAHKALLSEWEKFRGGVMAFLLYVFGVEVIESVERPAMK